MATLALVGRDLWLVADRRKPDAAEHAALLLEREAPALLECAELEAAALRVVVEEDLVEEDLVDDELAVDELAQRRGRRRWWGLAAGEAPGLLSGVGAGLAMTLSWDWLGAVSDVVSSAMGAAA